MKTWIKKSLELCLDWIQVNANVAAGGVATDDCERINALYERDSEKNFYRALRLLEECHAHLNCLAIFLKREGVDASEIAQLLAELESEE